MALIKGFKSTTLINAFILNALASALIAVTAVEMRQSLDKNKFYVTEFDKRPSRYSSPLLPWQSSFS